MDGAGDAVGGRVGGGERDGVELRVRGGERVRVTLGAADIDIGEADVLGVTDGVGVSDVSTAASGDADADADADAETDAETDAEADAEPEPLCSAKL